MMNKRMSDEHGNGASGLLMAVAIIMGGIILSGLFSGPDVSPEGLDDAAIRGDLDDVVYILEQGVDPNERLEFGQTPLHSAAWRGHADLVQTMIDHGGDVNRRDGDNGETPLIAAARGDRPETVDLLMQAGADPGKGIESASVPCAGGNRYTAGSTAGDIAVQSGFEEVANVLESY
ncbi:ankyrin repeat domain-containing protein [Thioalkalivibrio sp. ALJ24]|uniref:ankyrin repeat domain-containing protein n=1 Tax=Thioalkalivibrio sp. ALJ24 TaxID=545276 RepID=UPI0018DE9C72|nr:ankyrin repeat domain-containing protein [Thioalkalivibrio sp. ALJ24]